MRGVNHCEFILASCGDYVGEVGVLLFGGVDEVGIEPVDIVKLEALRFVPCKEGDGALLGEEMLGVGDGLAEGVAVVGEYPEAIGEIGGGLGAGREFGLAPSFDVDEHLLAADGGVAELFHDRHQPWAKVTTHDVNRATVRYKFKGEPKERSVISADDSAVVVKISSTETVGCFDTAAYSGILEVGDTPPGGFDDGAGATEGDGEGEF